MSDPDLRGRGRLITDEEGNLWEPSTQRADGTMRKARRVREGYGESESPNKYVIPARQGLGLNARKTTVPVDPPDSATISSNVDEMTSNMSTLDLDTDCELEFSLSENSGDEVDGDSGSSTKAPVTTALPQLDLFLGDWTFADKRNAKERKALDCSQAKSSVCGENSSENQDQIERSDENVDEADCVNHGFYFPYLADDDKDKDLETLKLMIKFGLLTPEEKATTWNVLVSKYYWIRRDK